VTSDGSLALYGKPQTAGETKTFRQPFFYIFLKGIGNQGRRIVVLDVMDKK
jgi:uncharacterized protein with WD repeat